MLQLKGYRLGRSAPDMLRAFILSTLLFGSSLGDGGYSVTARNDVPSAETLCRMTLSENFVHDPTGYIG